LQKYQKKLKNSAVATNVPGHFQIFGISIRLVLNGEITC